MVAGVGAPGRRDPGPAPTPTAGCSVRGWGRAAPGTERPADPRESRGFCAEKGHAGVATLGPNGCLWSATLFGNYSHDSLTKAPPDPPSFGNHCIC